MAEIFEGLDDEDDNSQGNKKIGVVLVAVAVIILIAIVLL